MLVSTRGNNKRKDIKMDEKLVGHEENVRLLPGDVKLTHSCGV